MNITLAGVTHSFATEAELYAFCMALRFEIRSERGQRRYFVDGQEVSEDQYVGAVEASALDLPASHAELEQLADHFLRWSARSLTDRAGLS